jgi:hypothetical protein
LKKKNKRLLTKILVSLNSERNKGANMDIKDLMRESCIYYLLSTSDQSNYIRENVTVSDYEKFREWVSNLDYKTVTDIVLGEQDEEKKKSFFRKALTAIKTIGLHGIAGGVKVGTVGGAAGGIVGALGSRSVQTGPQGTTVKPAPVRGAMLGAARGAYHWGALGLGVGLVIGALLYIVRDKCKRECMEKHHIVGWKTTERRKCLTQCERAKYQQVQNQVNASIAKCNSTKNPELCKQKLQSQSKIIKTKISQLK